MERLVAFVAARNKDIILDCPECTSLSEEEMACLLAASQRLRREKHRFIVVMPPGTDARRVLEVKGFDQAFTICDSIDRAIEALP